MKKVDNSSNREKVTQKILVQPSSSTPLKDTIDPQERLQFLKEMAKAREDMAEFRKNMSSLIQQMDTMTLDLNDSKERVSEIEHHLTTTQEVNVNLQVVLEKAAEAQKETDTSATRTIRTMYSKLATVVHENNQLQGRLCSLEKNQRKQQGNVHHAAKRIDECAYMLEQAQGIIHLLQPKLSSSRRTSTTSFLSWAEDPLGPS
ncbi:hypothetical protein BY458DRAFT_559974 [Sporodiniella umbellata]|nr:hypothetical protein BY458DRAFT_559974 [Sporodiniella umbellata]